MSKKCGLLLTTLILVSCGKNNTYIYVEKSESPRIIDISIEEFSSMLTNDMTFVSYITFSDLVDCGCSNGESVIKEYVKTHSFDFYRLVFDANSDNFVTDYNKVIDITGAEDKTMAIPPLRYEDDKMIIPLYPRMIFVAEGLIALNTDKNFEKYLDKYIRPNDEMLPSNN